VPSYDHPHIIAGQGTAGLEIAEAARGADIELTQALVCCGGGGLTAGSAVALRDRCPDIRVYTVEPEHYDDTRRSLDSGHRETADTSMASICDALLSPSPGRLTLPILAEQVAAGLSVAEAEVCAAMRFAARELKLVLEPGGAVALAAVLAGKLPTAGVTTAVMLSGGNVDADLFARIQAEPS
jgi:threonine dehydratase